MKKFWVVLVKSAGTERLQYSGVNPLAGFPSKVEAEDVMKRKAAEKSTEMHQYFVAEAISAAKVPVPDIEVVLLT